MAERRFGIRRDEVVWPDGRYIERHISSGSGWDSKPGQRGGGFTPERNPWKRDRPWQNPASSGVGILVPNPHGDPFQGD